MNTSWTFIIGGGLILLALMAGLGEWVKWLLLIILLGLVLGHWGDISTSFGIITGSQKNKGTA